MSFKNWRVASRFLEKGVKKWRFLDIMDQVIPWNEMVQEIDAVRPKKATWRPAIQTLVMLKIYCLQQRYNLADPAVEEAIYDRISFQRFLDIDIVVDQIPDETSVCRFRKLLTDNNLQKKLFEVINKKLEDKNLICTTWTIVDATIVNAPSSTKNKDKMRDPEMHSTKKGGQYYFGMKAHIGVDEENGIVHTLTCTSAEVHDSKVLDDLLHWKEKAVYGDSAYIDDKKCKNRCSNPSWFLCRRAYRNRPLTEGDKLWNKCCSSVRSKVEWVFWVIKDLRWHRKVRYRGIHKNQMQRFMLCGLANIYRMRNQLGA